MLTKIANRLMASALFAFALFDIGIASGVITYQPEVPKSLR
ncbi:MAG: cyclic lactone autoinducer peptide [Clostridia bacterium]|nr:cyclic lactone autoinducer peptide [Clostridia bacterium]